MGSEEVKKKDSNMAPETAQDGSSAETENQKRNDGDDQKKGKKKNKRRGNFLTRRLSCLRLDDEVPTVDEPTGGGGFNLQAEDRSPTHLVVMVNGIIGSAENWKYAAKQFVKAYPHDVLVHCSEANYAFLTFDGVDVMGNRLAEEVLSVVQKHSNLQKISFIGHSLGGLVIRYAIAKLYEPDFSRKSDGEDGENKCEGPNSLSEDKLNGKIAGLEPINFITSATPHLGSRGHKQVPVFCGSHALEKVASRAAGILGRTGKHLFLTDKDDGKPPLLLQMVNDTEELPFISALQSFKRRVAYANVRFDHLVGWSTSSLRYRNELPKRRNLLKNEKYPHIVHIESAKATISPEENSSESVKVKRSKTSNMEETMLRNLTKLSWERVDVSFSGSIQRFFAHNTIQVKRYCINSDGADVIQHIIDTFLL
ncbi:OLC1v1017087C3 [Oldenlandia corymbosa var. corymbosa]|uniref:OLC1v1017087C3 n=1 Tax=Oldenlandia corymbosa var. corymbosa TaxID=529605 RepID=A0AAV1E8L4_OLDCO|nr:OLC1v1017087C3 [Oldenlandia corymbosa var. corymbosa]